MTDDPLLQPFTLKHLTLRNRVFSSSHEPAYSEDGMPKDRYRLYHVEKAKGGIGDDDDGRVGGRGRGQPAGVRQPPRLRRRHRAVDPADDRRGPRARRGVHDPADPPRPADRVGAGRLAAGARPVAAARAGAPGRARRKPRTGTSTASSASTPTPPSGCRPAGWTASRSSRYGHLFDQFWSPLTNRRTDEYGGSLREPAALRLAGAQRDPRAGRAGLHRRSPDGDRRAHRGRHRHADRARHPRTVWRPTG